MRTQYKQVALARFGTPPCDGIMHVMHYEIQKECGPVSWYAGGAPSLKEPWTITLTATYYAMLIYQEWSRLLKPTYVHRPWRCGDTRPLELLFDNGYRINMSRAIVINIDKHAVVLRPVAKGSASECVVSERGEGLGVEAMP